MSSVKKIHPRRIPDAGLYCSACSKTGKKKGVDHYYKNVGP